MKVSVKLHGGPDLIGRLDRLSRAASKRVQRNALLAGAEPIRAEAAALAPRSALGAPHLADNIVTGVARGQDGDETLVEVGPAAGAGGNDFFYGHMQEFGTVKAPAQPFMRPAFDQKAPTALRVILNHFWAALKRESARGGVSGGRTT